jgi:lipoyl(octanoyl) transferase
MISQPVVKQFSGLQNYQDIFDSMRAYTHQRKEDSLDQIWFLEHTPVYTQGQAGKAEHILDHAIPVVQSDRGGQVTYHGPGQLMIYTLVDLKRLSLSVRGFVSSLEKNIIQLLAQYGIHAQIQEKAPGVYVNGAKICSLGLRVRHFRTYHGLSLNVNMDLEPFTRINPCGFRQLKMTQIAEFVPTISLDQVISDFLPLLETMYEQ